MKIVGVTGGIGSGKSMVSAVLRAMGYPVYDCDSEARRLMVGSSDIRNGLIARFGSDAYLADGSLNRVYLASRIFSSEENRLIVNSIVHPILKRDIVRWVESFAGEELFFVESAILFESNIDSLLSAVVYVNAPEELRVKRASMRDGVLPEAVMPRVESQRAVDAENRSRATIVVNNGQDEWLLPQIISMLKSL